MPELAQRCLREDIGARDREVFVALFLDAQHRVLAATELFRSTLTQIRVYRREVVKSPPRANAAAVIFTHPSGVAQPSQADELLTRQLLVEVKLLDHFIVAGTQALSFAGRGLL